MAEETFPPVMSVPMSMRFDPEVMQQKALELRALFQEKYADSIKSDAYDSRDLDRFEKSDDYVKCFLTTSKVKGDVSKGVDDVNEVFNFRKDMGLWDWTDETFPKDLWEKKLVYYHGEDKKGHPLLQIRMKEYTAKTPEEILTAKKFIVWHFEKHHREKAGTQRCVVILDMAGAGLGNVNMDFSKYIVKLFMLFPSFTTYVLNFEMHWLLSAAWKAISLFLSEDQRSRTIPVGKKEIKQYITEEHLLEHQK